MSSKRIKVNEENLQKKIKFFPHEGQQKILNSNSRLKVICAGRRFGKTMYAAYEVVLEALQGNKLIWTVGPDYDLAKVVFEQVHMYLELILEPKSYTYEKKPIPRIKIQNGTVIECKSGKNKKGMLGRATDLIVVDEAARLDDDVWYQYLKPTTHDKGAKTIMISCVTEDTHVLTKDGIKMVRDFPFNGNLYQEQEFNGMLYGESGFNEVGYLWENDVVDTVKVTTSGGYSIEGTGHHKVIGRDSKYKKNGRWFKLEDLTDGHFVLLQRNQQVFGNKDDLENNYFDSLEKTWRHQNLNLPQKANKDFAYLIGLIVGDGSVNDRGFTIINKDSEVLEFLRNNKFGFNFYEAKDGGCYKLRTGSDEFMSVLMWLGYKKEKAPKKEIPQRCLQWSKENICAMLSGLFDSDGCASSRGNRCTVSFTSTSINLINQVRMLLLNLGISSCLYKRNSKPTKRAKVDSVVYSLEINENLSLKRFKEQIGFRIKRKNDNVVYRKEGKRAQYIKTEYGEFFWKRVKSIENRRNKTYDFNIPATSEFFANGTISHNTPTGLNWFYDMWAEAGRGQFHFKSTDNPHFSEEEWQDVLKTTPKSRIQQEYLANFLADGTSVFQGIDEIVEGDFEQPREGVGYLIGVDLAKQDDFTACIVMERATRRVVWVDRFNDMDYSVQKQRIVALSKKYNSAKIIIDSSGPGDPIAEDIKRMAFTEAVSMHSAKVKQQLIEKLQIFIEQRLITIPKHEELIKELRQYASYSTESGSYRRFSAPKHKHDDLVMALALAVYGVYAHNTNYDSDNEDVIRRRRLKVFNDYE